MMMQTSLHMPVVQEPGSHVNSVQRKAVGVEAELGALGFEDRRPGAVAQRKLAEVIDGGPRVMQQKLVSERIGLAPQVIQQKGRMEGIQKGAEARLNLGGTVQLREGDAEEDEILQGKFVGDVPEQLAEAPAAVAKPNNTGLPNQLKSGIELLSGMSMDNVRVHYNSDKPAQLQAHAYAQGSEIHIGPGQEKHLPHEAWHVVQQWQGRVRTTRQMAGVVGVNDDVSLELEADVMGVKAAAVNVFTTTISPLANAIGMTGIQQQKENSAAVSGGEGARAVSSWLVTSPMKAELYAKSTHLAVAQLKKENLKIDHKYYKLGSYPAIKNDLGMELDNDEKVIINHWMLQEVEFTNPIEFKFELDKLKVNWEQQKVFYPSDSKSSTKQQADSTIRMYSARSLVDIGKLYSWAVSQDIKTEGFGDFLQERAPEEQQLSAPMKAHFGDSAHTRKHWHQKKSAGAGVGLISIDLNKRGASALNKDKSDKNIEKGGEGYVTGKIGLKQEKNFYSAAVSDNTETWTALKTQIKRIVLLEWEKEK